MINFVLTIFHVFSFPKISTVRAGDYYRSLFRPLAEIKERTASATALALEKEMSLQTSSDLEPKSVPESQTPT